MRARGSAARRGFVLVNALVLVAALSAAAFYLLARAEGGRVRVAALQRATQLELYLDAYENLARALLDAESGAVDHAGEPWARADHALPLDRGQVSGQLQDLQARFNLNWLANPEDPAALEAFERLTAGLGVSPRAQRLILVALAPGGGGPGGGQGVTEDPPGGAVLMTDQLPIPERDRARLRPYVTALPGDSRINVNTVSAPVLAAFLPAANPAALDAVLFRRTAEPFLSVDAFVAALAEGLGREAAAGLEEDRLSVGSEWFGVQIAAELEGRQARRRVVLRRLPLPAGAQVAYRLDNW